MKLRNLAAYQAVKRVMVAILPIPGVCLFPVPPDACRRGCKCDRLDDRFVAQVKQYQPAFSITRYESIYRTQSGDHATSVGYVLAALLDEYAIKIPEDTLVHILYTIAPDYIRDAMKQDPALSVFQDVMV